MHARIYVYRHKAYVALPAKVAYNCCNGCKMHDARDVYVVSKEITSHNLFLQLVGNGA